MVQRRDMPYIYISDVSSESSDLSPFAPQSRNEALTSLEEKEDAQPTALSLTLAPQTPPPVALKRTSIH